MDTDRRFFLDLLLAAGIGTIAYMYQSHLPTFNRILIAVGSGIGITIAARFFLGRLTGSEEPTEEELLEQLKEIESIIEADEWDDPFEEILFVDQAATLCMGLEKWPEAIRYQRLLDGLLDRQISIDPDETEELEQQRIQCQFELTYAYLQNDETDAVINQVERLRSKKATREQPHLLLLMELFYARALSKEDPEKGQKHINTALESARELEIEEDALQMFAFEWLDLGFPNEALTLLSKAHSLALERDDTMAQTETLFRLAYAHCIAGNLQESASLYMDLQQAYVYTSSPSIEQLDQLHDEMIEKFGSHKVKHILSQQKRAKK